MPLRLREPAGLQLIPTLRRENALLRSVSVICGGFMPLRANADDLSGFGPMVNVTRVDGATSTPLLVVGGRSRAHGVEPPARRDGLLRVSFSFARDPRRREVARGLSDHARPRRPHGRRLRREELSRWNCRERRPKPGALARAGRRPRRCWSTAGTRPPRNCRTSSSPGSSAAAPARPTSQLTASFRNGTSSISIRWNGR